jgi:maleate isomerase
MRDEAGTLAGCQMPECEMIEQLAFSTDAGIGARARIGLVVLASDYTVEHEFRRMFTIPGVDYYEARIRNSPQITPETLAAMGPLLSDTVDLILPGAKLDVVAFGCTSASMVLGEAAVAKAIHAARPDAKATNPITAAFAAFDAFGAKRIAVLTPYRRDVNEIVRSYITGAGYSVPVFGSFNEQDDGVVASIDGESLRNAVRTIVTGRDVDAVFVSCTSVRLVDAVCEIEAECGLPVTSSNHAMAWHCMRLAGVDEKRPELGLLFGL